MRTFRGRRTAGTREGETGTASTRTARHGEEGTTPNAPATTTATTAFKGIKGHFKVLKAPLGLGGSRAGCALGVRGIALRAATGVQKKQAAFPSSPKAADVAASFPAGQGTAPREMAGEEEGFPVLTSAASAIERSGREVC